jgi:hypothetical protein
VQVLDAGFLDRLAQGRGVLGERVGDGRLALARFGLEAAGTVALGIEINQQAGLFRPSEGGA